MKLKDFSKNSRTLGKAIQNLRITLRSLKKQMSNLHLSLAHDVTLTFLVARNVVMLAMAT